MLKFGLQIETFSSWIKDKHAPQKGQSYRQRQRNMR